VYRFIIFTIIFTLNSAFAEDEKYAHYRLLDKTRDLLSNNLDYLANRVDTFFATERADDEFGRSTLRIRSLYHIREQEKGDSEINYRLNFRIPSLEKRIKEGAEKIFRSDDPKEAPVSSDTPIPARSRRDWYFNADLGINASIPPKAVIRGRLRKNIIFTNWTHRFLEEVTYITEEDGLREETSFTSDYSLTANLLFRVINSKTWKVLSRQLATQHGPQLIHQLTERDGMSYSATAHSIIEEEGPWILDNYRVIVRYRRDLYERWIYFDINTGLDFPKKYSFRRNPFVTFQLEALFGS